MTRAAGRCARPARRPARRNRCTGRRSRARSESCWARSPFQQRLGLRAGDEHARGRRAASSGPNAAVPMRCCSGIRGDRAATTSCVAVEEVVVGRVDAAASRPRSVPARWAASCSASLRAESMPGLGECAVATSMADSARAAAGRSCLLAAGTACRRRPARRTARRGHRREPGRGCGP